MLYLEYLSDGLERDLFVEEDDDDDMFDLEVLGMAGNNLSGFSVVLKEFFQPSHTELDLSLSCLAFGGW